MRDATECTNPIGYALSVVIKAIFSNPNGLEMIMNLSINRSFRCKIKCIFYPKNSELKITLLLVNIIVNT